MIKLINKDTFVTCRGESCDVFEGWGRLSQGQMSQKSGEEAGVAISMYCIKHYFKGSYYYSDVI